jgi:hypothetical protein
LQEVSTANTPAMLQRAFVQSQTLHTVRVLPPASKDALVRLLAAMKRPDNVVDAWSIDDLVAAASKASAGAGAGAGEDTLVLDSTSQSLFSSRVVVRGLVDFLVSVGLVLPVSVTGAGLACLAAAPGIDLFAVSPTFTVELRTREREKQPPTWAGVLAAHAARMKRPDVTATPAFVRFGLLSETEVAAMVTEPILQLVEELDPDGDAVTPDDAVDIGRGVGVVDLATTHPISDKLQRAMLQRVDVTAKNPMATFGKIITSLLRSAVKRHVKKEVTAALGASVTGAPGAASGDDKETRSKKKLATDLKNANIQRGQLTDERNRLLAQLAIVREHAATLTSTLESSQQQCAALQTKVDASVAAVPTAVAAAVAQTRRELREQHDRELEAALLQVAKETPRKFFDEGFAAGRKQADQQIAVMQEALAKNKAAAEQDNKRTWEMENRMEAMTTALQLFKDKAKQATESVDAKVATVRAEFDRQLEAKLAEQAEEVAALRARLTAVLAKNAILQAQVPSL